MAKEYIPPEIREMDDLIRKANRDYPQPTDLDSRFLVVREVEELRSLIESSATETEIDEFIRGVPNILSSLLHFASTGHHGGKVYPQQVIRPSVKGKVKGLIPDYLISGENSEGTSWWVLELKGPGKKIFSGKEENIKLSDTANNGITQLYNYLEFCEEYQSSIRESLSLKDFNTPKGILLIGREAELHDTYRQRMKKAFGGEGKPVRIRTWDSFLRSLEHKLAFFGLIDDDPLRGEQVEDW